MAWPRPACCPLHTHFEPSFALFGPHCCYSAFFKATDFSSVFLWTVLFLTFPPTLGLAAPSPLTPPVTWPVLIFQVAPQVTFFRGAFLDLLSHIWVNMHFSCLALNTAVSYSCVYLVSVSHTSSVRAESILCFVYHWTTSARRFWAHNSTPWVLVRFVEWMRVIVFIFYRKTYNFILSKNNWLWFKVYNICSWFHLRLRVYSIFNWY